jgi:hypothetical protein
MRGPDITIDDLYHEYHAWCLTQRLPWISADELILEDYLTEAQREWLSQFIYDWDGAAYLERTG